MHIQGIENLRSVLFHILYHILTSIYGRLAKSLSERREMVMNREAWRAAIHGVTKSRTRLSDWTELNWAKNISIL